MPESRLVAELDRRRRWQADLELRRLDAVAQADRAEARASAARSSGGAAAGEAVRRWEAAARLAQRTIAEIDRQLETERRAADRAQEALDVQRARDDEVAERRRDSEVRARREEELAQEERLAAIQAGLFSRDLPPEAFNRLPPRTVVLLLAAEPGASARTFFDEEFREIKEAIQMSEERDQLDVRSELAVRPGDFQRHLNHHEPRVLHFAGHGIRSSGALELVDAYGAADPLSPAAVGAMLDAAGESVRVAVFNACFTEALATEVCKHVEVAIGTEDALAPDDAIAFSKAFYGALGYGKSVERAFKQGKAELVRSASPQKSTPRMVCREGVDPDKVVLVAPRRWSA